MSIRNSDRFTKSRNPVMTDAAFQKSASEVLDAGAGPVSMEDRMTVQGAINKSFLLTALLLITAVYSFMNPSTLFLWGGAIGGLIVVLIASFRPKLSPSLSPAYALLEGLFVGSVSVIYAGAYAGIVFQAICLTIGVLFLMLFIYKSGIIKVTNKFRTGVIMATGAIFLVYLMTWILSFFGIHLPFIHQGGTFGIIISLVIVGVASLNLLLDFDNIDRGAQYGAPKYMEWFSAMGLLITLVWLYLEILRLLAILNRE